jgi:hypothetical protein
MYNNLVTWIPINGCGDLVLVASLERVNDTKNLLGVTTGGCWVGENEADGLLWIDDEDRSDSESLWLIISFYSTAICIKLTIPLESTLVASW